MTRVSVIISVLAALFVLLCSGNASAIYSWVDEKGVTHISDYPKPGTEKTEDLPADDRTKENVTAPVQQENVSKGAQSLPPAAESAQKPQAAAAPVPAPVMGKQPAPPSTVQPNFGNVSVPKAPQPPAAVQPATPPSTIQPNLGSVSVPRAPQPQTEAQTAAPAPTVEVQVASPERSMPVTAAQTDMQRMVHAFMSVILLFVALLYLYFSLCMYQIARKLGVPGAWMAWVPILQMFTLLASASKSGWWILLFLIPFVNIIVQAYIWMCVTENLGREKWLGLLMLVPVVNMVYLGVLAFSKEGGRGMNVAAA